MTFSYLCEQYKDATTLGAAEERTLLLGAQSGDPKAMDKIVFSNMKLVISRGLIFCKSTDPRILDLISAGSIGLLFAVKRFDLTTPYRFSTYAVWWIDSFIRKEVRFFKKGQSSYMENLKVQFARGMKTLIDATGKMPTEEEVARFIQWPRYVLRVFQKYANEKPKSLDATTSQAPSKEKSAFENVLQYENQNEIRMVLNKLTAVEEDVIRHRYGIGCKEETLVKIAVFYGLARERIRQIEANALRKIFILLTEKRLPKKEPKPEKEESEEDQKRRKARLRVTQAMKRIDPVARDVLSRFYGINREGKQSIEEIAKIYGADITEIESIISRAHEAVEKSIKKIKDQ